MRRGALLGAGRDLLLSDGPRAVTMAAVAKRAGLSRPAVYEYFSSSEALVGELLLEEMRAWSEEVCDAVARARTPRDKVRTYVRTTLDLVAAGRHRLGRASQGVDLPEEVRDHLVHLHHTLASPLTQALAAMGVDDPQRASQLLQGVVEAATRRVEAGAPVRAEARAAERFVLAGLAVETSASV